MPCENKEQAEQIILKLRGPAGAGTLTPRGGPRRRLPPSLRGERQRWLPSAAACGRLERLQVRGGLRRPPHRGPVSGAGRRATAVLRGSRNVRFRPLAERMTRARDQIESSKRLMPASKQRVRKYILATPGNEGKLKTCRHGREAHPVPNTTVTFTFFPGKPRPAQGFG